MKKKLFWGISLLAICLTFFTAKLDLNTNNDSGLLISNIEAYASDSEGGNCLCENDVECKDLKGCR